ncbi:C39 family peptidase [Falsibacillus pallidus]
MGCSQGADEDKSISLKDKPAPVRSVSYKEQPVTIKPEKKILDVPIIAQNPELKYGCEVTSLAMLLQDAGVKAGKMELAQKVAKDPDPVVKSRNGDIIKWGDPSKGFVGDMTGRHMGYAVYDQPLENLMNEYLPGRTVNLTGQPFDRLLEQIQNGKPVIVWTTGDFRLPDRWESWSHGAKKIRTPLDLHVVVLVGYDADSVYLNDPLSGKKAVKVNKARFIASWKALGERAVSYA